MTAGSHPSHPPADQATHAGRSPQTDPAFVYREGELFAEGVRLSQLLAEYGSPLFVYSRAALENRYDELAGAFAEVEPTVCYSVKSCGNIHLLKLLAERGAGMDVVSGGELHRAKLAGVDPSKVLYAGVGKTDMEIAGAIREGIGWFNIESEPEAQNIARIAREVGSTARGALRINPDVDPKTHAKTTTGKKETKFGVPFEAAQSFFERFGQGEDLRLTGLHLHIGSPVYSVEPYVQAISRALEVIRTLRKAGYTVDTLDIGGGFAMDYETGAAPPLSAYAERLVPLLRPFRDAGGRILLEPGRTIAANAGVLGCTVQYVKESGHKRFAIIDSGMHHLIRPTLYDAFHFIWPCQVSGEHTPQAYVEQMQNTLPGLQMYDVVGPICETGDYLAQDRHLPPMKRGDELAVFGAGAYGMTMSSQYNAMPRPAEVLVDGIAAKLIRRRETWDDLVSHEMGL